MTRGCLAALAVVMLGALVAQPASMQTVDCAPSAAGAPMLVTGDCVDPRFKSPYIDVDEMRTAPVPHRYVHGGFTGTDAKFAFYFPYFSPREQYQGRFFQPTHQLQTSEISAPANISFPAASGAYWVQTNMGGSENPTTAALSMSDKYDPAIRGYRVNAVLGFLRTDG